MGERYPLMINTIERCFSSFFFSFFSFFFLFFLMFSFPSPLLLIDTSKQQNSSQLHLDQINSPHLSKPAIQINGSFLNFFYYYFFANTNPTQPPSNCDWHCFIRVGHQFNYTSPCLADIFFLPHFHPLLLTLNCGL